MKKIMILLIIISCISCKNSPKKMGTDTIQNLSFVGNGLRFKKCSDVYSIKCEWQKPVRDICKVALDCPGCSPNQLCMGKLVFWETNYLDAYIQTYDEVSKSYKTILTAKTIGKDKVFEIAQNMNSKNLRLLFTSNTPIKEDFDVKVGYIK
jgi:hypothetical protein